MAVIAGTPALAGAATPATGAGGEVLPAPVPRAAGKSVTSIPLAPRLGTTPFGVPRVAPARLRGLSCLGGCGDPASAAGGARLRLRGTGLADTDVVVFRGGPGDADDVAVRPQRRTPTALDVRVPLGAASGPVTVADRDGRLASAPLRLALARAHAASAPRTLVGSAPQVQVQVAAPRGFYDAAIPPHATYVLHTSEPAPVTVEVVRDADQAVVASWDAGTIVPGSPQIASWDGVADGRLQRPGRYEFRITAHVAASAVAVSSQAAEPVAGTDADPGSFVLLGHAFPVRGPHYYGEGPARFGGARHHEGQDVLATCGTPVVAARGGRVRIRDFQSAAGNYLVIHGARDGVDYGYMHLRARALVAPGQRVRTGQLIGYVGDTGDASACHLHVELWTPPGWYAGGHPYDPLPSLRRWDRSS